MILDMSCRFRQQAIRRVMVGEQKTVVLVEQAYAHTP